MKRLLQEGQSTLQSNMAASAMKHSCLLLMTQEFPSSDAPGWNCSGWIVPPSTL